MKPTVFAVLLLLLPVAAEAQSNPQRSSGKKMQWVGIGGLLGGAGIAVLGAMSGKESVTNYATTTASSVSNCTGSTTATSTLTAAISCVTAGTAPAVGSVVIAPLSPSATSPSPSPINPPGGQAGTSGTSSATPLVISSTEQHRAVNWKMVGPAIGVAGAGAFLTHLGHVRVKKAELSIRPTGAVQLAFKW